MWITAPRLVHSGDNRVDIGSGHCSGRSSTTRIWLLLAALPHRAAVCNVRMDVGGGMVAVGGRLRRVYGVCRRWCRSARPSATHIETSSSALSYGAAVCDAHRDVGGRRCRKVRPSTTYKELLLAAVPQCPARYNARMDVVGGAATPCSRLRHRYFVLRLCGYVVPLRKMPAHAVGGRPRRLLSTMHRLHGVHRAHEGDVIETERRRSKDRSWWTTARSCTRGMKPVRRRN